MDEAAGGLRAARKPFRIVGAVVIICIVVAVAAITGPRALNRVRGGPSAESVATGYLAAVQSGDSFAIRWLTPVDREELSLIDSRIERYRRASEQSFQLTYVPHGVASYLITAHISGSQAGFVDEVLLHLQGNGRWYLILGP